MVGQKRRDPSSSFTTSLKESWFNFFTKSTHQNSPKSNTGTGENILSWSTILVTILDKHALAQLQLGTSQYSGQVDANLSLVRRKTTVHMYILLVSIAADRILGPRLQRNWIQLNSIQFNSLPWSSMVSFCWPAWPLPVPSSRDLPWWQRPSRHKANCRRQNYPCQPQQKMTCWACQLVPVGP